MIAFKKSAVCTYPGIVYVAPLTFLEQSPDVVFLVLNGGQCEYNSILIRDVALTVTRLELIPVGEGNMEDEDSDVGGYGGCNSVMLTFLNTYALTPSAVAPTNLNQWTE